MTPTFERKLWAPRFFLAIGIFIGLLSACLMVRELGYYILSPAQRPFHPHHSLLRASGIFGLKFGILSAGLMLVNLSYLLRKRLLNITWLGELRSWMAFHVLTGLTAAVLVFLHSGFRPRSSMGGLSFVAMIIVIATGIIGRYIYAHTPRSVEGSELEIEDIRRSLEAYRASLETMGMPADFFRKTFTVSMVKGKEISLLPALKALIGDDLEARKEYSDLRRMLLQNPALAAAAPQILPLAKRYFREIQWLDRYYELRALMSGWRFYHRWLAIVLLAAVSFHVLIAVQVGHIHLGSAWIPHVP